jgi:Branched-chain polyamine synthase A C-terminal domain
MSEINLKDAMNTISDVIQNRPRALREFDQIYMKAGDMMMQSEFVARWAKNKRLCFIGDGDAISVCVALLDRRKDVPYGPSKITVLDFDERIVNAVNTFAEKENIGHLDARLYNVLEALPDELGIYDCFYTNPPWGQYNDGTSVSAFVDRGIEAVSNIGEGLIVIGDDPEALWTHDVLAKVQTRCLAKGFYVARMQPELHLYHLDDAPDLKSCNLLVRSLDSNKEARESLPIVDPEVLHNFYGRSQVPRVRFVREVPRLNRDKAAEHEYNLELLEDES